MYAIAHTPHVLRFLETGEIQRVGADRPENALDVRLIAATNRDLLAETKKKTFREDLYYRLHVVHLARRRHTRRWASKGERGPAGW